MSLNLSEAVEALERAYDIERARLVATMADMHGLSPAEYEDGLVKGLALPLPESMLDRNSRPILMDALVVIVNAKVALANMSRPSPTSSVQILDSVGNVVREWSPE